MPAALPSVLRSIRLCCSAAALGCVLAGCRSPTVANRARDVLPLPQNLGTDDSSISRPVRPAAWFDFFGNEQLLALIERALSSNFDVSTGWARLAEARAMARQAGAALWPSLDAGVDAQRQRTSFLFPGADRQVATETLYTGSIGAAYEIDLWGRLRKSARAAALTAEAAQDDLDTIAMSTAAQVATTWLDLISGRVEEQLLLEQLRTTSDYLELAEFRLGQGLGAALDVTQQQQQVEAVRTALTRRQLANELSRHQLAVLVGTSPQDFSAVAPAALPELPPAPMVGMPATLLERRPDIRAAMLRLRAADAETASVVADQLPSLRLTGSLFTQASSPGSLFETLLWTLGAGAGQTLFDGGRKAAAADAATARAEQQLFSYASTLAAALQEVASALEQEDALATVLEQTRNQLEAARKARDLAMLGYRQGTADYQRVLDAINALNQLEREELQIRRDRLATRVRLHRALGGTIELPASQAE